MVQTIDDVFHGLFENLELLLMLLDNALDLLLLHFELIEHIGAIVAIAVATHEYCLHAHTHTHKMTVQIIQRHTNNRYTSSYF